MYKNRIRHATPKLNPNSHPKFFIRRSDIAFEKRVRYIESVCQILIESRFGPGRVEPVVINFSDRPEPESAVFFDLCEGEPSGLVPFYSLSPLGRTETTGGNASVNERALSLGTHNSTGDLPPNQGRGSPLNHFFERGFSGWSGSARIFISYLLSSARSARSAFQKVPRNKKCQAV